VRFQREFWAFCPRPVGRLFVLVARRAKLHHLASGVSNPLRCNLANRPANSSIASTCSPSNRLKLRFSPHLSSQPLPFKAHELSASLSPTSASSHAKVAALRSGPPRLVALSTRDELTLTARNQAGPQQLCFHIMAASGASRLHASARRTAGAATKLPAPSYSLLGPHFQLHESGRQKASRERVFRRALLSPAGARAPQPPASFEAARLAAVAKCNASRTWPASSRQPSLPSELDATILALPSKLGLIRSQQSRAEPSRVELSRAKQSGTQRDLGRTQGSCRSCSRSRAEPSALYGRSLAGCADGPRGQGDCALEGAELGRLYKRSAASDFAR